jgi:hypothetical protein
VSVWWDAELTPGVSFVDEIEGQLRSAKNIIILWSRDGISSKWLRAEADYARETNKLIQIRIDDVKIPLTFFSEQSAIDLSNWRGDLRDENYLLLLRRLNISTEQSTTTAEERAAWAVAQSVNTIQAYQVFAAHHPTGTFAHEASRRISKLSSGDDKTNIFISYRREDSKTVARLVYEHLKTKIDEARIFFDVTSISPGQNFKEYIKERLIQCSTVLVIIGPQWVGAFGNHRAPVGWRENYWVAQDLLRC